MLQQRQLLNRKKELVCNEGFYYINGSEALIPKTPQFVISETINPLGHLYRFCSSMHETREKNVFPPTPSWDLWLCPNACYNKSPNFNEFAQSLWTVTLHIMLAATNVRTLHPVLTLYMIDESCTLKGACDVHQQGIGRALELEGLESLLCKGPGLTSW